MSVLVVGSVAYDNVETPQDKKENLMGGAALFFANAASYFVPVNLVAVVGRDFELEKIQYLKKRGVDFDGLEIIDGKTFRWGGRYLQNMKKRKTLFTELNVFGNFHPKIPSKYQSSDFVFLANIQPDLQYDVLKQVKKAKCVAMDTMNFWISGNRTSLENLLKKVDILIINDEEVRELAKEDDLIYAVEKIHDMGPEILVVKKGENGALMSNKKKIFTSPAFPLKKVFDPTGAGDTFAGGFVGFLAKTGDMGGQNLRKAVVYGSIMASFVCEDFSFKRLENIEIEEIEQRYQHFKEITSF